MHVPLYDALLLVQDIYTTFASITTNHHSVHSLCVDDLFRDSDGEWLELQESDVWLLYAVGDVYATL